MLGAAAIPVSLTLDYGPALAAGEAVRLEARVDRQTRTLAFAHARIVRARDGAVAAAGSAVFRRARPV
jgi:acyl-coenzyme A thioesterase PaaI-like protein